MLASFLGERKDVVVVAFDGLLVAMVMVFCIFFGGSL